LLWQDQGEVAAQPNGAHSADAMAALDAIIIAAAQAVYFLNMVVHLRSIAAESAVTIA
jgi:hypothetical protein